MPIGYVEIIMDPECMEAIHHGFYFWVMTRVQAHLEKTRSGRGKVTRIPGSGLAETQVMGSSDPMRVMESTVAGSTAPMWSGATPGQFNVIPNTCFKAGLVVYQRPDVTVSFWWVHGTVP